jgi:PAS domain S-box-containing protein
VNVSLEKRLVLGFGAALLLVLLVTAAAWWNLSRFRSTYRWINHTHEVISRLEQAIGHLVTMQASTRGFVITGQEDTLRGYAEAEQELERAFNRIRTLTSDNPTQQERLARLNPTVAEGRALLAARIAARRERGLEVTGDTSAYVRSEQTVSAIRAALREMVTEEERLLTERLQNADRTGRLSVATMITASLFTIAIVVFAMVRFQRDLRLRRTAEQALRESSARIEDLYNHAPCGYHSLDRDGRFVEINDTALEWLGLKREEVVGRLLFSDVLTPESAAVFKQRFEAFQHTGSISNVEYEWRRRDGSTRLVLLNAVAIYGAKGDYVASRATVFDVTEIRRAQVERDRFFTLSHELLCLVTHEGVFKRVNPAWKQTLGFEPAELIGRTAFEFIHPEDHFASQAELERLLRGEETVGLESRWRTVDGSYRWLQWSARSTPGEKLIYASARDITERKAADERIRTLNADLATRAAQLESANSELESFSYSVSHDLRAPLRHIDGFSSLLTRRIASSPDPEVQRYVATISRAARQMGTLIDDLLAFSRIGRTPLRHETVNSTALVAEVIREGHYRETAPAVAWEISPLPDVHADAALLRQVWANLIDNAVKYSSKVAAPRITIGLEPASDDYVFFVRDNGVGFDMAYADKLFGVFQRLHGPTEFEGTGIGLANVRRIVSRHGGRTWAESRVDEGAVFYFSLPKTPAAAIAAP